MLGNEAEITASWLYTLCLGLELVAGEVKVNLLAAELQGVARVLVSVVKLTWASARYWKGRIPLVAFGRELLMGHA